VKHLKKLVRFTVIFSSAFVTVISCTPAKNADTTAENNSVATAEDAEPYTYAGEWKADSFYYSDHALPIPITVAPNGDVFASSNGLVQRFSPNGVLLGGWEVPCNIRPGPPNGVAVGPNGVVYVSGGRYSSVLYYEPDGVLVGEWEAKANGPIAVGPSGNVYVCGFNTIERYSCCGDFIGRWGTAGSGPGEFKFIIGIGVAPNGDVYVADAENGGVQYFSKNGSLLGAWGRKGDSVAELASPGGVSVGEDGRVFVTVNGGVKVYSLSGSFLDSFDLQPEGGMCLGRGIAVGSDGDLYLTERYKKRILKYEVINNRGR
jgi:hypothetical protein